MQMTLVGYNPEKYTGTQLIYITSMDQTSTITNSAKYYEQYISYFWKMLRLLNTPGRLRIKIRIKITISTGAWNDLNRVFFQSNKDHILEWLWEFNEVMH